MSSTVTNLPNGVVVVTHVLPAGSGMGLAAACSPAQCLGQTASSLGQTISSMTGQFLKGHPKALGTVQIMIGLLVFLIGIVMSIGADSFGVYSGIFVWGAIFYIIAGSLTVAAANKTNKCLVNGSLGMNIVAAVAACTGTILYSLDATGILLYWSCNSYDQNYYWSCERIKDTLMGRSQGISGVLVIFSLIELVISICVSAFACKATCCNSTPQPEQVFIIGNHLPQGSTVIPQVLTPPRNMYETVLEPKGPEGVAILTAAHLNDQPPQYTPVFP